MRVFLFAAAALVVAAVGLPSSSAAQAGRADVQEGNRLYREGRYDEAHERYLEALRADPDSPVIRFNDANALYQSDEFARAVDAYRGAIEAADPVLEAQAWYNLGNALYRQQQVEGALEAYKEALRRNPGDTDAKHNLEVALEQLQQQQQQQQQRQSDDSENQDQENQEGQQSGQDGQEQTSESQQPQEQPPEESPEEEPGQDEQQDEEEEARQSDGEQPEPETGEADAQPQPGQMSREEAERLLQAITEDPGEIRRQRRSADPGRRTRRPW